MIYGVILAGGEGRRLWPESCAEIPKPFLSPLGYSTLLEETVNRILPLIPFDRILVSTAERSAPLVRRACPEIPSANLLTEPFVRNTAPAIGMAAAEIERRDPDGIMAILPSDHDIESAESLRLLLDAAVRLIDEDSGRLVTIGISPSSPSSAYGYMKAEKRLISAASIENFASVSPLVVESFHEKPDETTAKGYLADGHYFWNAGIFVWKARRILELIRIHRPDLAERLDVMARAAGQAGFDKIRLEEFRQIPSVSIDYAVLEKTDGIILLPAPFRWSDLGSFESFSALHSERKDAAGNLSFGIETIPVEATGNLVRWNVGSNQNGGTNGAEEDGGGEILALAGVDDLIVVRRGKVTLIAKRGRDDLIQTLAERMRTDAQKKGPTDSKPETGCESAAETG